NHSRSLISSTHLSDELVDRHGGDRPEETLVVIVRQECSARSRFTREADHNLVLIVLRPVADLALVDHVHGVGIGVRPDENVNLIAIDAFATAKIPIRMHHLGRPLVAVRLGAGPDGSRRVLNRNFQPVPCDARLLVVAGGDLGGGWARLGEYDHSGTKNEYRHLAGSPASPVLSGCGSWTIFPLQPTTAWKMP